MGWLARHFEIGRNGGGGNLPAMEGLRGLAVFLVFLTHYATLIAPWVAKGSATAAVSTRLHAIGNVGVDLFFVLSGYLIYGALLRREQPFLPYLKRRVQRLYPAFAAVFGVYVLLSFLFPAESKLPTAPGPAAAWLLANFLLLPGIFPITPLITVAWSLSYEFFFYLTVPALLGLGGLRRWQAWQRVTLLLGMAGSWLAVAPIGGNALRMVMFAAGMVLYETLAVASPKRPAETKPGQTPRSKSAFGAIALLLGLASTLLPWAGRGGAVVRTAAMALAFGTLCHVCLGAGARGWLATAFSVAPLRWLGNASYSYYLVHGLAIKAIVLVLAYVWPPAATPGDWLFWLLLPVVFVATLPAAGALFLLVEKPWSLESRPHGSGTSYRA